MAEIIVTGHTHNVESLKNPEKTLRDAMSRMTIEYWLSAGTALGLYRDDEYISGDTDIDIAVEGYDGIKEDIIEMFEGYDLFRVVEYENKVMQMAFYKEDIVDIYIHWEDGENLLNVAGNGLSIMPKRIYRNLENIETRYGSLPFPSPVEEYLEIRYGDEWSIPSNKKPIFYEI